MTAPAPRTFGYERGRAARQAVGFGGALLLMAALAVVHDLTLPLGPAGFADVVDALGAHARGHGVDLALPR